MYLIFSYIVVLFITAYTIIKTKDKTLKFPLILFLAFAPITLITFAISIMWNWYKDGVGLFGA